MGDLDDGDGADRAAVVEAVSDEIGVAADDVEDAIQDALMSGRCYEPDDGTLKPICGIEWTPTDPPRRRVSIPSRANWLRSRPLGASGHLVADYHAGYEDALRYERGVDVPGRAPDRRERVLSLVDRVDPDRFVVLGDLMHSIGDPAALNAANSRCCSNPFPRAST